MQRLVILGSIIGLLALLPAGAAGAAGPPRVGTVSCGHHGSVAFPRTLQYSAAPRPDTNGKAVMRTSATGCSGTQTGGNPHKLGPIDHATVKAIGDLQGHTCSELSAHGVTAVKTTITWFSASGVNLGVTKVASGAATVSGLGNGVPSGWAIGPPNPESPPGIITITYHGTADASSTVFPGASVHATFVADRTVESFPEPCSLEDAPLKLGIPGLDLTGVNGPSAISVS
jgi:hypothetical protein